MASEVLNRKTKLLIVEKLSEIMLEKPLDRIRVSDVVSRCGISRRAFYYHFNDIYEALGWMLEEEWKSVISPADTDWKTRLDMLLTHFQEHNQICRVVLSSSQHFRIEGLFCSLLEASIRNFLQSKHGFKEGPESPETTLMIQCYALSMTSVFVAWINDKIRCSKEMLIQIVERAMVHYEMMGWE